MTSQDLENMSEKELLKRMYTAQIRMMMDIERTNKNVLEIRRKIEPEAFDPLKTSGNDKPDGFMHLSEIHDDFDYAFKNLPRQIDADNQFRN